ncbi:MAG: hypothetical protein JO081_11755, partial [Alphaproteobacteria bacterium]|nr:hypothetical protein [Alphaproteobacteria bacterium]
ALIAGSSNYVSPKATLDALIPAMNYFAVWSFIGLLGILFFGIETRGRTIEEIDRELMGAAPEPTPVRGP